MVKIRFVIHMNLGSDFFGLQTFPCMTLFNLAVLGLVFF